jgi:glycosyltransferase involved in cell wall biosynthesis
MSLRTQISMRVLIATTNRNLVGGVERYLQRLIPALRAGGHKVALLYEDPFDPAVKTIDSLDTDLPVWCHKDRSYGDNMAAISEWAPDFVYSQGLQDPNLEDALVERYSTILYAHNYYGTCISGAKCHLFPSVRPCTRQFGKACLALYYPRRCGGLNPVTMMGMFERQTAFNRRLGKYKAILVASSHMYREFEAHGVAPEKLVCAPPPNPEEPLPNQPADRIPRGDLLFIGRMTDLKGPAYALQAAAQASRKLGRRLRITFAGDGAERVKLESMAQSLNITVEFVGWVNDSQRRKLIREADLLIVPSLWPEPFGLVGIEAGALGLPAAGFAVGGIPDWLIPGVSGELAPSDPPTVEGLSAAIVRTLEDPARYNQLRLGAWTTARGFTVQAHLERLEQTWQACFNPDPAGNPQPFTRFESSVRVS